MHCSTRSQYIAVHEASDESLVQRVDTVREVRLEVACSDSASLADVIQCKLMTVRVAVPVVSTTLTSKDLLATTLLLTNVGEDLFPSIAICDDLIVAEAML